MVKKYLPIIDKFMLITQDNYWHKQNTQAVKAFLETYDDQSILIIEAFNYPHLLARTMQTFITDEINGNNQESDKGSDGQTRTGKTSEKPDPNEIIQAVIEDFAKDWKGRDVEFHVIEGFGDFLQKLRCPRKYSRFNRRYD